MDAVRDELRHDTSVLRAYLAIVQVDRTPPEVALCLSFSPWAANEETIARCGRIFYEMFSSSQLLAIIPISEEQERKLTVIPPFYSRNA
jgi:SseB protein C-terminal domain